MNQIKDIIKRALTNNGKGWTIFSIIKITILIIVALFALSIILAMFKWVFNIDDYKEYHTELGQIFNNPELILGDMGKMMDSHTGGKGGVSETEMFHRSISMPRPLPIHIPPPFIETVSRLAESYETRDYSVSYQKRNIENICNTFNELKPLEYVVFQNSNISDTSCNFRFKVEVEREEEIIAIIKSLDPKDFNVNTFTLERTITNNRNEIAILERKIKMLDSLLERAQDKYTALRNTDNATALVQAINNEINLIERVTNQKLSAQSRIDRLTNRNITQEERVDYSQFNISISEKKFIDWSGIGDQWKFAFEKFVSSLSESVQGLSIGLIMFIFNLAKFVIFLSLVVVTVVATTKFLWIISKRIWKR